MKETIEVETGLASCGPTITIRISASDLVVLAKAMQGREYLDLCITDGIRRIANIDTLLGVAKSAGSGVAYLGPDTVYPSTACGNYIK